MPGGYIGPPLVADHGALVLNRPARPLIVAPKISRPEPRRAKHAIGAIGHRRVPPTGPPRCAGALAPEMWRRMRRPKQHDTSESGER